MKLKLDAENVIAMETIVPLFHEEGNGHEKLIVATIIQDALKAGYSISARYGVDDFEDAEKSTDLKAICPHMFDADTTTLYIYEGPLLHGWIHLIPGNAPWEVVSDLTPGQEIEAVLARAEKLAGAIKQMEIEAERERHEAWVDSMSDHVDFDTEGDPAESFGKAQADAVAGHRGEF